MSRLPPYILTNPSSGRHLYGRGWLGLIPLFGFFVGIGLLTVGIVKYKDKKLIWIGVGAIFFTVAIYGSMFLYMFSDTARKQWATIVPHQLNTIVRSIEFYKVQHGQYPDSLEQVHQNDSTVSIYDPVSAKANEKQTKYNYMKINNRYMLFSSGIDKKPKTADDIFPTINTTNIGLIRSEE
jgi:hypothetical protein